MATLLTIQTQVEKLGALIDAPQHLYPTYGHTEDFARPHIEIDNRGLFHFVVIERGRELERQLTSELNELLYWIFEGVTFSMACRFELKNRIESQDFRRILFRKQEEFLGKLNPDWQLKTLERHKKILIDHPFGDSL